ncbi:serine/threonine-protein kinase [Capillimicrobium parvum]|nr:serine/threonine-protein kinase [Capillimicrobium parvum]
MRGPAGQAELLLGRYRLGRRLGAGGFGTVWLAQDERLNRPVALKRIPLDDGDPERAEREAQAAARLSHPGIVTLYETGSDEEACYLVSEFVRGATFGELLAEGALSDRDIVVIGASLCEALAHAHARGVIHRDVKPGNIMVSDQAASGTPAAKICDFGIARIVGGEALTRTGDVVGTLAYMAPEQAEGKRITGAADVYALGLVLYEALSGVNPIRGAGPADTARKVGTQLPDLGRLRRDLPPGLCAAIDAAVAVRPQERSNLSRLRAALVAVRDEVDDEPGIVEGSPVDELSTRWTAVQRRYRDPGESGWLRRAREGLTRAGAADYAAVQEDEPEWIPGAPPARHAPAPADAVPVAAPGRRMLGRAFAAGSAAALAGTALHSLADAPPVTPAAGAAVTAGLVVLLPRLGWLLAAWAIEVWLLASGFTGTAVVLAVGLIPVPLALPLAGTLWSVPGGGPALGALGLAGAFPAFAGQAATATRRAALGALGLLWLELAELLTGDRLLAGPPDGGRPRVRWEESAGAAFDHAIVPMFTSGLLAVAALWALAAVLLPWVVRGRSAALDLAAAAAWSIALAVATEATLDGVSGAGGGLDARGLLASAVVGAVAAVGLRAARRAARPSDPRLP